MMTSVPARPEVAPPRPWTFPRGRTVVLPNGLTIQAFHLPGKQIAAVKLVLDVGHAAEPAGLEGLGNITFSALKEGTACYDAQGLSAARNRIGASFSAGCGSYTSTVSMRAPLESIQAALDLLAEAVLRPSFPASGVDRLVKRRLDGMTSALANPGSRAGLELAKVYWASTSRWAVPAGGTAESVARIDRSAVESFYARHLDPATATLVVAGDLSGVALERLVDERFGAWAASGVAAARVPAAQVVAGPRVVVVDRPGSVQTQLLLTAPAVAQTHPDLPSISVAAYVLGGGLDSRIMAVLREEKGYTYGINAAASTGRDHGQFTISGAVQTPVTGAAVQDLLAILRDYASGGIRDSEHRAAVEALAGRVPLQYDSPQAVAGTVASLVADGLPADYVDLQIAAMRATTVEGVNAAYSRSVGMDRAVLVAVGDGSVITEPLRTAGLGPVTVIPA